LATIVHDDFRDGLLGKPDATVSTIDFDTDVIDLSLLDETDSTTITAAYIDYAEVNAAVVVDTGTLASITIGVLGTGVLDSTTTHTFTAVTGDAADFLVMWKNLTGPSSSPLAITWDSATTGLPVLPNGGDIIITWAGGGILSI